MTLFGIFGREAVWLGSVAGSFGRLQVCCVDAVSLLWFLVRLARSCWSGGKGDGKGG